MCRRVGGISAVTGCALLRGHWPGLTCRSTDLTLNESIQREDTVELIKEHCVQKVGLFAKQDKSVHSRTDSLLQLLRQQNEGELKIGSSEIHSYNLLSANKLGELKERHRFQRWRRSDLGSDLQICC